MTTQISTNTSIDDIIDSLNKAGLESRDGQRKMMHAVADTLKQRKIAVIEGGTGIGKTFGYLVPALRARREKQKIIIATATIALQNQLFEQDLPKLEKLLGISVRFALAKGRRRYVCAQRLYHADDDGGNLSLFGIEEINTNQADSKQIELLVSAYETNKWNGDHDALDKPVADSLWRKLTTDAAGCANRQCDFFQECAYFKAKKRLQQAEVIITNHDLLLSDIAMGTGTLLPPPEDAIYIIDEAHHFPNKAVQHFTATTGFAASKEWLGRLQKGMLAFSEAISLPETMVSRLQRNIDQLLEQLPVLQDQLQPMVGSKEEHLLSHISEPLIELVKQLQQISQVVLEGLREIRVALAEQHNDKSLDNYDALLASLSFYLNRCEHFQRTWQLFVMTNNNNLPPVARWVSQANHGMQVHAAMTSAATFLPSYFWDLRKHGVILCSATLKSLGKFDRFLQHSGLQFYPNDVTTQAHESPFPYEQSTLQLVDLGLDPTRHNQSKFASQIATHLPALLQSEQHGVLVLFTSRDLMHQVYDQAIEAFGVELLVQGERAKEKLLRVHRQRVDQGERSILFGLQSFAEGVDLPGDYCRHVLITKLPFSVPNTPVEQVIATWWSSQGQDAFMQHSLPQAGMRLVQFAGRLVRSHSDTGTISILDRRITTKQYGKSLLAALPPFTPQRICYTDLPNIPTATTS